MKKSKKDILKAMMVFSSLYPRYSAGTLIYSLLVSSKLKIGDLYQMPNEDLLECINKAIVSEYDESHKSEEEFKNWVNKQINK